MTVAPELPPVLARRGRSRRLRVVVDRTPAGVVALVEPPRPRGALAAVPASVVVPAAPVEPGIVRDRRPVEPGVDRRLVEPGVGRDRRLIEPGVGKDRRLVEPGIGRNRGLVEPGVGRDWRLIEPGVGPTDPVSRRRPTTAVGRRPASAVAPTCTPPATDLPAGDADPPRSSGALPAGLRPERTRAVTSRPAGARVVRPAPGHLRLTRRGRLVTAAATLLIAVLTLVGVVSRAGSLRETAPPVPASAPAQVVVAPGETLWSIAERVAPDRDPRTVVAGIQRLNDLRTPDVHAGQTLLLRAP